MFESRGLARTINDGFRERIVLDAERLLEQRAQAVSPMAVPASVNG
jgi:hypothetical protein